MKDRNDIAVPPLHRAGAEADRCLGIDLTPPVERPILSLSEKKLPMYEEDEFRGCWVLSPDCRDGFRPAIGEEMSADQILGWQCLHLTF